MSDRLQEQLRRWLAAEHEDAEAPAEEALQALFRSLPQPAPRPGLALRVLAAAGLPRRESATAAPWMRWAAAAVLVLSAAAALAVPFLLQSRLGGLSLAGGMERLAEAVSAASRWLAGTLAVWQKAAALAAELLATPEAAMAAVAGVLLAAASLRWLTFLIGRERELSYASP